MFEWTYDHEICRETCLYVPTGDNLKNTNFCKIVAMVVSYLMMCPLNLRLFGKHSSGKKMILKNCVFLGTAPRKIIWV